MLSWLFANILCLRLFEVEFSAKVHGNAYINRKMFEIRKESLQNCTLAYFFEISTNLFLANIGNKIKKGVHIFGLCCTGVTDNIKDGGLMRDRPGL